MCNYEFYSTIHIYIIIIYLKNTDTLFWHPWLTTPVTIVHNCLSIPTDTESEAMGLGVAMYIMYVWRKPCFYVKDVVDPYDLRLWSVAVIDHSFQTFIDLKKEQVTYKYNIMFTCSHLKYTPFNVSAPVFRRPSASLEKNWSTSSWVCPTGKKLIRTYIDNNMA